MTAPPIRVLIADDHRMFRQGVVAICERQAELEVVGQAKDGLTAVAMAERLKPDVIIMDIRMPGLDGIRATAKLVEADPGTRVIMLTMHADDRSVIEAIKAGARGYLLKQADADELLSAIRAVHAGEALIDASLAARVLDEFRRMSDPEQERSPDLEELSPGEMDVLTRVAKGMDNGEIADELSLAPSTIGNRLSQIYVKLHVNNRTQAALEALRRGWASLDDSDESD